MYGFRKTSRLAAWDYSDAGCYFVTFCTYERRCTLGEVLDDRAEDGSALIARSEAGEACRRAISRVPELYPQVSIDASVVMPNHVHLLCCVSAPDVEGQRSLLSRIVGYVKSSTTKCLSGAVPGKVWQRSFHDHVLRDELDYLRVYEYIQNNPAKWAEDKLRN